MTKPPLPTFKTDQEAEDFVADPHGIGDLTQYDLTGFEVARYTGPWDDFFGAAGIDIPFTKPDS